MKIDKKIIFFLILILILNLILFFTLKNICQDEPNDLEGLVLNHSPFKNFNDALPSTEHNHMNSLKLTNSSFGSFKEDSLVRKMHKHIFKKNNMEKINIIVAYLDAIPKATYHENYFNLIIDCEPNAIDSIKADFTLTTKKNLQNRGCPNTIYVPEFLNELILFKKTLSPYTLIKNTTNIPKKTKFCCFMYSNCLEIFKGVINRKNFFEKMNKISGNRVDNLGRCYNDNYIQNHIGYHHFDSNLSNVEIYKPYKFVIAFENDEIEGNITEKLIVPIIARAIPIYLGAPDVASYFNKKSFICVNDFKNFEDCIKYVLKVDSDNNLYNQIMNEPFLINNELSMDFFSPLLGGSFYKNLEKAVPENIAKIINPFNFWSGDVNFVTFQKESKLKEFKEIKNSYLFNKIHFNSLSDFSSKKKKKIEKNYWNWKSYVIHKTFKNLNNNDILIYADSDNFITTNLLILKSKIRLYFDYLENCDILCFSNFENSIADIFLKSNKIQNFLLIFKYNIKTLNFLKNWKFLNYNNFLLNFSNLSKIVKILKI